MAWLTAIDELSDFSGQIIDDVSLTHGARYGIVIQVSMTLREILDLPALRAAAPVVTTHPNGLGEPVSWVHSSEIFEIGPLLSGGELLLTTGLGLAGADAGARRHWIRDLRSRGVVAVAIEVGRSFTELPRELVDEANRCGLSVIRLDRVVPFEQICRAVNTLLVDRESAGLRLADRVSERLFAALTRGGLAGVTRSAAEQAGCAVVVVTGAGQAVAVGGVASRRELVRVEETAQARAAIIVDGHPWGEVLIAPGAGGRNGGAQQLDLQRIADRVAGAAAVAVAHLGDSTAEAGSVAVALLEDLLAGSAVSEHELVVRAGLAGLHPAVDGLVLGVAARAADPVSVSASLRTVGARAGGALVGRVRGQVLALVAADTGTADPPGTLVEELRMQGELGADACCVVGPAVSLGDAGRSLREACAMVESVSTGVRTWREHVPDRLLELLDEPDRRHLVDDVLGPLEHWDRAHGSDLVRTVDAYLRHGCSASRTASALHVRRQSLHQRLRRIEEVLGYRLDDPSLITTLLLATRAARTIPHVG